MTTKKAKRKRPATPVAVVEAAKAVAPSQPTIVLASHCNVKDAGELKQSLCHYLYDVAPVALDVGKFDRVGPSTIQLLCALVRDRTARDRKVEWIGTLPVIRDAAHLLGVE